MTNLKKFDLDYGIVIVTGGTGLLGSQYMDAIHEIRGIPISLDLVKPTKPNNLYEHKIVDITNEDSIRKAVAEIKKDFSGRAIVGLINNAAIDPKFQADSQNTPASRLENYDLGQWNREIAVGLTGAFLCTKHIAPEMAQNGRGSIINISSVLGLVAPNQGLYAQPGVMAGHQNVKPVTYSVIKHGIIGLTRYTATYFAQHNIRCNALAPGGVFNNHSEDFVHKLSKFIPLGRMADRTEYNQAIQFLISDASSFMTGAVLTIDGGQTTW